MWMLQLMISIQQLKIVSVKPSWQPCSPHAIEAAAEMLGIKLET